MLLELTVLCSTLSNPTRVDEPAVLGGESLVRPNLKHQKYTLS